MKRWLLVLGLTVVAYVVFDTLFGVVVPMPRSYFEKQRLAAVAYQDEPYFNPEFVSECVREPGGWETPDGTRMILPKLWHGKYFNVDVLEPTRYPYRRTSHNPEDADVTVLLLGGSTMYGADVPDDYTVASLLAKELNASGKLRYRVLNAGVTTVNTNQELDRLRHELQGYLKPDVVASLDGVNDVVQGVYYANPQGQIYSASSVKASQLPLPRNVFTWARLRAEAKSIENTRREAPAHMKSPERVRELARSTAEQYRQNLTEMAAACREAQASFVSFLQPSLYTARVNEADPDVVQARALAAAAGPELDAAFRATVPELQKVADQDLTDAFSDKRQAIFLDFCHVNGQGNLLLAKAMAPVIRAKVQR